jgi:hypothetical protein
VELAIATWAASSLIPATLLWALVSLLGAPEAITWLAIGAGETVWMALTEPTLDKVLAHLRSKKAPPEAAGLHPPTEGAS